MLLEVVESVSRVRVKCESGKMRVRGVSDVGVIGGRLTS